MNGSHSRNVENGFVSGMSVAAEAVGSHETARPAAGIDATSQIFRPFIERLSRLKPTAPAKFSARHTPKTHVPDPANRASSA